jgi:DNA-binding winged helix-turn-helix (wHTH) protein/tetratricopeptide (TPR) repeat protein
MSPIRFDDCELDPAAYELRRGGVRCALEPQVFDLLAFLVREAPRLVTRDELIAKIWAGRIVSDATISSRIKSARHAIGDDGAQQRLIRTVHGRGFCFVGALTARETVTTAEAAATRRDGASGRPAVAVLPLRPASGDAADRALADIVSEDIVTCLARDRTIAVSSAVPAADVPAAGARYVLDGGLRHAGGRLAVTVRLTDAVDGTHLWAERCERLLEAGLPPDDGISRTIAAVVRGEIETAEARRAALASEPEWDAWAHYHLGLKELYRFTEPGLAAAHVHFARAVALDPDFASAWARLAYVHIQLYWYGPAEQRATALAHAQEAALRAIDLDPKNALGYFACGRVHALRHEFDRAMPAFEMAIRLNPGLAQAYFAMGQAHFYADRPRDAVRLLDVAIELDPHDPHLWCFLHDQSDAYYAQGELDAAARRSRAASLYPNATHWPFASLASVLGTQGRCEEAREALGALMARRPDYSLPVAHAELAHFSNRDYVQQFLQGLQAAGLQETNEA